MIRFSRAIGNIWLPTASMLLVTLLLAGIVGWATRHKRSYSEYWVEQFIKSEKARVADFCWHLRQLIVAGETWREAVLVASQVQRLGCFWTRQVREDPFEVGVIQLEAKPELAKRFPLLDLTMTVDDSDAKLELLSEITNSLWGRCRSTTEWWIGWFNSLLFWGTLWLVSTVVIALLMPLFMIFSGLV